MGLDLGSVVAMQIDHPLKYKVFQAFHLNIGALEEQCELECNSVETVGFEDSPKA